jgi:hypothetical protein
MDYKHNANVSLKSINNKKFKEEERKSKRNIIIKNYDIRQDRKNIIENKDGNEKKVTKDTKETKDESDRFMYDLENWDKLDYSKKKQGKNNIETIKQHKIVTQPKSLPSTTKKYYQQQQQQSKFQPKPNVPKLNAQEHYNAINSKLIAYQNIINNNNGNTLNKLNEQCSNINDTLIKHHSNIDNIFNEYHNKVNNNINNSFNTLNHHHSNLNNRLSEHHDIFNTTLNTHNNNINTRLNEHHDNIYNTLSKHNVNNVLDEHHDNIYNTLNKHNNNINNKLNEHHNNINDTLSKHNVNNVLDEHHDNIYNTLNKHNNNINNVLDEHHNNINDTLCKLNKCNDTAKSLLKDYETNMTTQSQLMKIHNDNIESNRKIQINSFNTEMMKLLENFQKIMKYQIDSRSNELEELDKKILTSNVNLDKLSKTIENYEKSCARYNTYDNDLLTQLADYIIVSDELRQKNENKIDEIYNIVKDINDAKDISVINNIENIENIKNIKDVKILNVETFNEWQTSDYDEHYNINKDINIVHKQYFSENNLTEIQKSTNNKDLSGLLGILNISFYSNLWDEPPKNLDKSIYQMVISTTKHLIKSVNLLEDDKIVKYKFPPVNSSDKLKLLFDMIITGFNTQLTERGSLSGILKINKIVLELQSLLENYVTYISNDNMSKLKLILDNISLLITDNDKELLSWQQLMIKYFTMINMIKIRLRDIYESEKFSLQDPDYYEILAKVNIFIHDYLDLGKQISQFIIFYYEIGSFLTSFISSLTLRDQKFKLGEINTINSTENLKWWNEHIILILDYYKSLALNDEIHSKIKSKLCILEVPPKLIELFEMYDTLMNKNIYDVLDTVDNMNK